MNDAAIIHALGGRNVVLIFGMCSLSFIVFLLLFFDLKKWVFYAIVIYTAIIATLVFKYIPYEPEKSACKSESTILKSLHW